jgi:redox-sensitive bicupin YhaK (pirin superfamily)
VHLSVDALFEHGILLDAGQLTVAGTPLQQASLAYLSPGTEEILLEAGPDPVRAVLMGGTPFGEEILMWWNFVTRTHEEILAARAEWQAAITGDTAGVARFGRVTGYDGLPLPAPALPNVRLKPRSR